MSSKRSYLFTGFLGFLLVLWATSLWIVSSLPGQNIHLPNFKNVDKVAHFSYFAVGGFLWAAFLSRFVAWRGWKLVLLAVLVIALIGAGDEIHQLFTPNRSGADVGDWLADCAGGFAGAIVVAWIYALTGKRRPEVESGLAPHGDRST